jgi:hypothetical protein
MLLICIQGVSLSNSGLKPIVLNYMLREYCLVPQTLKLLKTRWLSSTFFPSALLSVVPIVNGPYSWVADSVIKQTPNWHIEGYSLGQWCTKFRRIWDPPQSSRCQKGDMRQAPYSGPTNIRRHCKRFSHTRYLVSGICTSFGLGSCVRQYFTALCLASRQIQFQRGSEQYQRADCVFKNDFSESKSRFTVHFTIWINRKLKSCFMYGSWRETEDHAMG